jgi:hypothetical protein
MSKSIELQAAEDLAQTINQKHDGIMRRVETIKADIMALSPDAAEVGMLLRSAHDTLGASYHHWVRESLTMTQVQADRYVRHYENPDQLWFPGWKRIEDRASVQAQAQANAEIVGDADAPKPNEVPDIEVRDIAWGWVYDATRCFRRLRNEIPPERATKEQAMKVLEVVKSVRDDIYAYEQRLLGLTRGET